MGRAPCCSKVGLRTGPWSATEDTLLTDYIRVHGEGHWRNLPKRAGLLRCGKSCRLRWVNYLRPDIKRGNISSDEEDLIIRLHSLLGNRWSLIAKRLPGRTDNEIKNYWNSNLSKSKRVETSKVTQPRVVKKKNQSTNGKKQKRNNDNKNTANEEVKKTKIYFPKAVKVSPYSLAIRSTGFDNLGSGSSSPSDGEENQNIIRSNDTNPVPWWSDLLEEEEEEANSEVGGRCRNGEPSLANYGSDFSFLDFVPIEGNILDEMIGEYQQLLNFGENVQPDSLKDFLCA